MYLRYTILFVAFKTSLMHADVIPIHPLGCTCFHIRRAMCLAVNHLNKIFAHAPRPYLKSILFKIEKEAPDLFKKVRSTIFRSWKTPPIMPDFVPRWLEYNQYAEIIQLEPLYIESGSKDLKKKLSKLELELGRVPFFCINDTSDNAHPNNIQLQLIKNKLNQLIPNKSIFEK